MESTGIRPLAMALAFGLSAVCAAGASAADMAHKPKGAMHAKMHDAMMHSAKMHSRHHRAHMRAHMGTHMRMADMASAAARPMRMAKAAVKPAGSCGTYMYWKAGACVDARVTPAKK